MKANCEGTSTIKKIKLKKCKWCHNKFEPRTPLQSFDFPECYFSYLKEKNSKKTMREKEKNSKIIKEHKEETRIRKENDRLFQIIGKEKYPYSIISGQPTEAIHHFVYKSDSNNTRYDLEDNAIPLTNDEHYKIHNGKNKSAMELQIGIIKGQEWQQRLLEKSRIDQKMTIEHLKEENKRLKALKRELT